MLLFLLFLTKSGLLVAFFVLLIGVLCVNGTYLCGEFFVKWSEESIWGKLLTIFLLTLPVSCETVFFTAGLSWVINENFPTVIIFALALATSITMTFVLLMLAYGKRKAEYDEKRRIQELDPPYHIIQKANWMPPQ